MNHCYFDTFLGDEDSSSTGPVKEVEPAPVKTRFAFLPKPIQVPQLSLKFKPGKVKLAD
jgi:hypothetical protein